MANGSIILANSKFYIRYCAGSTLSKAGKPRPIQKAQFLHAKDDNHRIIGGKPSKALRDLRDDFMRGINDRKDTAIGDDMDIVAFYETRFLPGCEAIIPITGRPRCKTSTMRGYKHIWRRYLKEHFTGKTLKTYQAIWGSRFLKELAQTKGRNTLRHIRSLAASIFEAAKAVGEERITKNTWDDVQFPDTAKPANTPYYSWQEAEDVISALVGHPRCQLIMALACFMGLRPNEIAGLRWEDVDSEWLHIRRGVVHGILDTPKSVSSVRNLPLMPQVKLFLSLCFSPAQGWIFPGERSLRAERIVDPGMKHLAGDPGPADIAAICRNVIIPIVKAAGLTWKPLKGGRTGAATEVIHRSGGNAALAQALLGHADMATTTACYKKAMPAAELMAGMLALKA